LLIATWNLRAFSGLTDEWTTPAGGSPARNRRDLIIIAEIVRLFDLVVLAEVKSGSVALDYLMSILGDEWSFVFISPAPDPRSNNDTTVFVFDTRRVIPAGLFDRIPYRQDVGRGKTFTQLFFDAPYAAFFRSRLAAPSVAFGLVVLRVDYGTNRSNLNQLSRFGEWLRSWAAAEKSAGRSLLMLGDYGLDRMGDPAYEALRQSGLVVPRELDRVQRSLFGQGSVRQFVDHVAWMADKRGRPLISLHYTGHAGCIDFVPELRHERTLAQLSWHISDHYPLWTEFAVPRS
jgi:hypothetical protein